MKRAADKVRIGIVTSVHVWNDTRIFFKEAVSLAQKGYQVTLVGVSDRKRKWHRHNMTIYTMKKIRRAIRWMHWFTIVRILVKERSDIIHFHDPELIPLGILMRLFRKRVIFDMHEDFAKQLRDKEWIPKQIGRMLSGMYAKFEDRLPQLFNRILLAEDSYRDNFRKAGNIEVVRNFPRTPAEWKKEYTFETFTMVYVGDLRAIRGIKEYIKLLEVSLRNGLRTELVIIGRFAEGSLEAEIKGAVHERGLEANIRFLGRLPNEEIYPVLRGCDVGLALLHPVKNYVTSYPTKIFEYMAAGLPVVASNFALWQDIILQNECGYCVQPFDTDAAYEAIKSYYFSEDLRRKHGENGRNAILAKYNWENEERVLCGAYQSLIRDVP